MKSIFHSAVRDIPHITPITCPACQKGSAALVRRGPNAFRQEGKSEIWTFKCELCGKESAQTVET